MIRIFDSQMTQISQIFWGMALLGFSHEGLRSAGRGKCHLPADEQTLVPPQRRSRRYPIKISASLRLRASALQKGTGKPLVPSLVITVFTPFSGCACY